MILASQSPRRRELLSLITEDFEIIPAKGEENIPEGTPPAEAVKLLAAQKAQEVYSAHGGDIIIAADTVVALGDRILGKPADEKDAADMLTMLSGTRHSVFTGVCIISPEGEERSFVEETTVDFWELSQQEIADYVATGEPMDKAGAYGIQDLGALLVRSINGDYYNVMGLPVGRLLREMRDSLINNS